MTDTNTLAPTDADILDAAKKAGFYFHDAGYAPILHTLAKEYSQKCFERLVHAVLAKWGAQPVAAPVGMEPVYQIGQPFLFDPENTWRDASKDAYDVHMPNRRRIIYTASQVQAMLAAAPSGPAREPLTDEQVEELRCVANRGFCIESEDYFKAFRDAEAAHGIK